MRAGLLKATGTVWPLVLACSLCPCLEGFAESPISAPALAAAGQKICCVDALALSPAQRLLLDSLQALANSNAPALFALQRAEDVSWRQAMEQELAAGFEPLSLDAALARFGVGTPQVIYAPDQRWSLGLATALAGVHRALLTDHELPGHAIAFDCRGRWANKVQAYRWALAELWTKCNPTQLAYLDDGLFFLRDYAIQQQLFVIDLDPLNSASEISLLEEILAKYPAQTRAFGWASGAYARTGKGQNDVMVETALVTRLSRRGLLLVPADFAANLSFYSQTGPRVGPLHQTRLHRALKFEAGKRYILLVVSDGDNLQYDLGAMRAQWQRERPKVPVAWSISPQLAEVGPAVLQAYYHEAAERGGWDEFVAGPSGYAYINPGSMPPARLAEFVQSTRRACERADFRSIVILDQPSRPPAQVAAFIRAYATAKVDALWLAAMPNYLGSMNGTAFLNERFRLHRNNPAELARQVSGLKAKDPFVMIYVNEWEKVGEAIRDFVQGLDSACVLVSPTEMAGLLRQWTLAYANARQITARPGVTEGLAPVPSGDGEFSTVERNGEKCWLVSKDASPRYFYLDANAGFRGGPFEVELEYLDTGSGDIALDYDSTDAQAPLAGAYKRHAQVVHRANSAQWQQVRFRVTDARFADRENDGTDFRFYNGGDDLLIRAVRVRRVGP